MKLEHLTTMENKLANQDTITNLSVTQPAHFYRTIKAATIQQAVNGAGAAIAKIKKERGEPLITALLIEIICSLTEFFSVGKGMNNMQTAETARLILQEFYFLKLEDFKVFSDYMKAGRYGKAYDRVDGNTIMINLRQYCAERAEICETAANKAHEAIKEQDKTQKYYCELKGAYVRDCGETYDWVDQLDFATQFTYEEAYRIKTTGNPGVKIYKCEALERALANPDKIKELNKYLEDKKLQGQKTDEMRTVRIEAAKINAMDISDEEKELRLKELYRL